MPKIILASKSKARKKLLKEIGLKFICLTTNAVENKSLKRGCSRLVVGNALAKARQAVKKYPSGLIIAADTVVLAKGKLIGKPKDLKDAQKTIKLLSCNPHWVYSGLAVTDGISGKTYTSWDKTKIYMSSLDKCQIESYCRNVLPLDKAGSFDIQGPGGLFIERIEGCYYNVIGLPLVKLVKILKKLKIDVFSI